ncbi:MAG: type III pantothenate kinase [Actinomycetia bacterium]|nr:type III pantothenate kinase [Actinomycetes bacterium]
MLLAVDIGNTQTAFGIFNDAGELVYTGRIATTSAKTPDELAILIHSLFARHSIETAAIDRVVIASVVPSLTSHWVELSRELPADDILLVDAQRCGGLEILLDNPAEAGADRLANAIGAIQRYGAPAIVVDFGTATNIDVIDGCSAYRGGVISPGLETSADALFSHAARLSAVDLDPPERVIGSSTRQAIQAGLMRGEAAKVDGLVSQVIEELGAVSTPTVIATGGLAQIMAPLCSSIAHIDSELTLCGLFEVARREESGI